MNSSGSLTHSCWVWVACYGSALALTACVAASDDAGLTDAGETSTTFDSGRGGGRGGSTDSGVGATTDSGPIRDSGASGSDTAIGTDAAVQADARPPIDIGGRDTATEADTERVGDDCTEILASAEPVLAPVDIIWAIDTSGSMNEEVEIIEGRINDFAAFISETGLDYRVVMVAGNCEGCEGIDVCVPEPLSGAPGCPDTDSEVYRHVRQPVFSHDALEVLVAQWPSYSDFIRPDSEIHFVVVSDDESDESARWFAEQIDAVTPSNYTFHSIVSLTETEGFCVFGVCQTEGCEGPYGSAEAQGEEYMTLSEWTFGVQASICDADWDGIFDEIGRSVVRGAALPCEYVIPDVGFGLIVYDEVTVEFTGEDGVTREYRRVNSAAACSGGNEWYYDDNESPTRVHICPAACGEVAGELDINFLCVKG